MRETLASALLYTGLTLTGTGVLVLIVAVLRHIRWFSALTVTVGGIILIGVAWEYTGGSRKSE